MLYGGAFAQESAEQPQPQERTLATVNGEAITDEALWWYMEQTVGGRLLDEMILRTLLTEEAEKQGVKVGTPEVDEAIAAMKADYASEEAFERWLHESGQTMKGLRLQVQQELLVQKLLEKRVGLTEEGIREYYEAHPEEFTQPPRVWLYDIVTLTLDEAFEARERLATGEEFPVVAREMSHDPTAEEGGDRGWIVPDDVLCENVAEVVFGLAQGEIAGPVDCEDHYHVFWARAVEPGRLPPLEECRTQVIERIREIRGISEELYLTLLRRRAEINVTWEPHAYLNELYADLRAIKLVVDDVRVGLTVDPVLLASGNLIVPGEALLIAMGADTQWDAEAGVLEATRDGVRLRMVRGVPVMAVGDREVGMKEAPQMRDGVLMISPRAVVEALDGTLRWSREENTLYVETSPDETADQAE